METKSMKKQIYYEYVYNKSIAAICEKYGITEEKMNEYINEYCGMIDTYKKEQEKILLKSYKNVINGRRHNTLQKLCVLDRYSCSKPSNNTYNF